MQEALCKETLGPALSRDEMDALSTMPLATRVRRLQATLEALQEQHQVDLTAAHDSHGRQTELAQASWQSQLDARTDAHRAELARLEQSHVADCARLREEEFQTMAVLRTQAASELSDAVARHQTEVNCRLWSSGVFKQSHPESCMAGGIEGRETRALTEKRPAWTITSFA